MTKYLQSRSTHIIVKCILGIIILSLIFSTMSSYINKDFEKYIATVNGEKISFNIFKNMYLIEREKQKKMLGKNFLKIRNNTKFIKDTYNYVLSQLINNILLEQYAKKMQLQVNDHEIKELILNSPMFQKNEQFNKEQYFNYLASVSLTNHEYINIIKKKINTENLIRTIANSNFVLENEEKNIIKLLSQKRIIKRSIIKTDSVIYKQNVTNIEAKNYFHRHKNSFYIPEKFKIRFVQLTPDHFKTNCNNKEIHKWYLKNLEKYSTKEKRRYSIIQTKNKDEALIILSKLQNTPEDFSKIAKEKSIDPISSKKGGDIGWISADLVPNEIKNANLNKKNQISTIIPFHNEFLIIKLNDIIIKQQKKIHEVSDVIKKEIQKKKSLDLYNNLNNKISNIIKNNPNQIKLILKKNNMLFQETRWFDKKSIPEILNIHSLKKIIFNKELFRKKKIIKTDLHFIVLKNNQSFLIKIKNFRNKKMPIFENIKNNIIQKLKFIKAVKETKEKSKQIINELKIGKMTLFQKSKLFFTNAEIISRYDQNFITPIIFSLPHPQKGKKIYTLYQDENKDFVIVSLEQVYSSNFSEKEKNIVIEYLEKNNNEIIFNAILKDLREKSIIKYEKIEKI